MNIEMELAILLLSIIVGLLGLFGSILFAKQIKNDDLFILLVAFLFSTSPVFLKFTIWTTATRHIFMALFPFFLWSLLKIRDFAEINWKYLFLIILIFIMLLASHRMGLLSFIIIFAFITTILLFRYFRRMTLNKLVQRLAILIWIVVLVTLIILQVFDVGIYKDINITQDYQSGNFFIGNDPGIILINMIIDYSSRVGILSIFGLIGFGLIFFKRNKSNSIVENKRSFIEIFILLIILYSSSVFLLGLYLSLFLLLILILLICLGVLWSFNLLKKIKWNTISKNKKIFLMIFITFLLVISLFFSIFMIQHWFKPNSVTNEPVWIEDDSIDCALYLNNYNDNQIYFSNIGDIKKRMEAWQTDPIDYRIDLESISIEKGGIIDLITEDTLYIKKEGEQGSELYFPLQNCNDKKVIDYLDINNIKYILELKSLSGKSGSSLGLKDNDFLTSMHEERYKIYENNLDTIWLV